MIFVNMLDRYSDQASLSKTRPEFLSHFQKHYDIVNAANQNVRFVAGSAMAEWNTKESWDWITKTVAGEVNT